MDDRDYIHFNPMKHALVPEPGDGPYSSFQRCVAAALYPEPWLGGQNNLTEAGERV